MPAGYRSLLIGAQGDGSPVTLVAEASLLPAQAKWTLPAGFIDQVGKKILVSAHGRISNVVTSPGILTIRLKFGAIVVATSVGLQLNAVAKTNVFWRLEWLLTARSIGGSTSATFMHQGLFVSESVVGSPLPAAGGAGQLALQPAAPAVGTGFDSTVSNVVDLAAIFGTTGNSMTLHDYALESLN